MRLLLVRHGETLLNLARVLQPADTALSPRGHRQARALAERLAAEPLGGLWSSQLPRALQTAQAIAAAARQPVNVVADLQERHFGDLRGRAYDSLGFDPLTLQEAPPGGESAAQFQARVAQVFGDAVAAARVATGAWVVVTHGLVIRAMLEHHVQLPAGRPLPQRIANASVTVIEDGAAPRAVLVDCTAHLAADAADDPRSLSGG